MANAHDRAGRHCVTAVFDHEADARKAMQDLVAQGFAAEDIELKSNAALVAEDVEPKPDPSVLTSLLNIFVFMPSHDRMTLDEAMRRGGVALAVWPEPDRYEEAIDILDRDGAINLEEREVKWADDGWSRPALSSSTAPADATDIAQAHDPLLAPDATPDVRERIGTGTADMTAATAVAPGSAATVRDSSHGRGRVRSYKAPSDASAGGNDPSI